MKRLIDVTVALAGLAVLAPVLPIIMVIIRLQSAGPAIFAQQRVGRHQKPFICYKLRTMKLGTRNLPTHQVDASSMTSIGGFLRRTKLDELPQLFNVLRGDMSLVGPRPCLPTQTELIDARLRKGVLNVRPGMTGLAQVQGVDMSEPQRLADIDSVYVKTQSIRGDCSLLLRTLIGSAGTDRTRSSPAKGPRDGLDGSRQSRSLSGSGAGARKEAE